MPQLKPKWAGLTWRFSGTYYVDGAATSLSGASIRATLKYDDDDLDAAAVATITTALTDSGQITLTTGETGLANSGWIANFKPAATVALVTTLPDADLFFDIRVRESDLDEWIPLPVNPDDPIRIPVRRPNTRAI
jgi:hypothetical protein